ncbi:Uncharacterised protein [Mycoplasmopsis maculosa]|uniref:DUF3137 domain-containing protein n=1 Tax=Mycoplasmopsis maculosa TaxID=114885 RepID=A0A449B4X8_9BACT|nr:hypothetical protein [Mycoplasmopsis maculosa]VEU75664.1 Uncharacterised protein [Mycoplasmopsis maculosa]
MKINRENTLKKIDDINKYLLERTEKEKKEGKYSIDPKLNKTKKLFIILFSLGFILVLIGLLFLIPTSIIYVGITENSLPKWYRPLSWIFFGVTSIGVLIGSFFLSKYFKHKTVMKESLFKNVDLNEILPSIFEDFNLNFEVTEENHLSYNVVETAKAMFNNQDNLEIYLNDNKTIILTDKDTESKFVIYPLSIKVNKKLDNENAIVIFGTPKNAKRQIILGGQQNKLTDGYLLNTIVSSKFSLKAVDVTNIDENKIKDLNEFIEINQLETKQYGFVFDSYQEKENIWIRTSNKLFDVSKTPDLVRVVLAHSLMLVSLINKVDELVR